MPSDSLSSRDAEEIIQRRIDADVADRADAFLLYDNYQVQYLARRAQDSFGSNRSQMRALERIANSASTYSEVLNYVKSQSGRNTNPGKEWRYANLAYDLHDRLEEIRKEAEGRANGLNDDVSNKLIKAIQGNDERKKDAKNRIQNWIKHELRVRYVRKYVSHLVAEYMYLISQELIAE